MVASITNHMQVTYNKMLKSLDLLDFQANKMRLIKNSFCRYYDEKEKIIMKDKQSRKYQLTINNPIPDFTHDTIKQICFTRYKSFRYSALVDEIGNCGTYHTHIFISFDSPVRFSSLKKHFPTAHIETAKGSIEQNLEYLKKSGKWKGTDKAETTIEGSFEEFGERPPENKGKRKDLEELYHMIIDEGLTNAEIIRLNQDYIMEIDKLDKIRTMYLQDKFRCERRTDLSVCYVYGLTGAGKSRDILDEFGDENVYRVTDYVHPFDGYCNEPIIVFEEFRSSLPLKEILNYLDIYPIQLKARYANKFACFKKIFLCTNWKLEKQYSDLQSSDKESWDAFLRRIHKVKEYTENGIATYDSVTEYLDRHHTFTPVSKLPTDEQMNIPFI